ncbi:BRI1 kinase inhibitor 1-like [Cynara cardunculus var. scolymus]|uniref:BRI1 kinase inhibitor 1 n=1 Tax=Cynara cardunculus var. scolymus TaxID=59895 RepID=A0A124SE95_CYNCS|nr:BRI1 kinase inhibitor 1-like [Cynara cardunculus var. scolymus]KVH99385.1 hypothetical protein Ccrd_022385 [Cynara cardunculus var. scolymus]
MLLQESGKNPSSPPPQTTSSPPSVSSSPTHEFSFTVSLRPHPPPTSTPDCNSNTYDDTNDHHKTNHLPPPSLAAIDLSPADDIFFHGHLLPLHLLSHLPVSPRSSTNSMDSFTLPIKDLLYDPINPIGNTSFHCHHQTTFSDFDQPQVTTGDKNGPKSKPFSLFGIPKWKKRCDDERERDEDQNRERNNSKKLKLDLGQLIKRYMKMVRPLLSFPKSKRSNRTFNHQSYSFSGNSLSSRRRSKPPEMMNTSGKRRGQFSLPASMKTSPTNSGILLASGTVSPAKSTTSESTMEELHAAIQAAIAHCKNSIAMEDKLQS